MNHTCDIFHEDKTGNVSKITSRSGWKVEKIFFTNRTNLDKICELVVGNVGLIIR